MPKEAPQTPAGKRNDYTARRAAMPPTPTNDLNATPQTPPTCAPSHGDAIAALRGVAGFEEATAVDALLRSKPPLTPRPPSAWSPVARPPLAEQPQAAVQPQPSAPPQKRRSASGSDSRRKRHATASAAPPQRPCAAPRPPPAARAPPTALAPVAPTGGGVRRQKRPAPPSDAPNGSIKFEPNPYPKNGARWTAYEQYKDSQTLEAFFENRGTIEDLARDHRRRLVSGLPRVMDWVRKLQQRKKAKTGSQ